LRIVDETAGISTGFDSGQPLSDAREDESRLSLKWMSFSDSGGLGGGGPSMMIGMMSGSPFFDAARRARYLAWIAMRWRIR
jgi:hypothetical protein